MIKFKSFFVWNCVVFILILTSVRALSDSGITVSALSPNANIIRDNKAVLANSKIYVKIECNVRNNEPIDISITYSLLEVECSYDPELKQSYVSYQNQLEHPNKTSDLFFKGTANAKCPDHMIVLEGMKTKDIKTGINPYKNAKHPFSPTSKPLFIVPHDGIYVLTIKIEANVNPVEYLASTHIEIVGPYGYIPAIEYPLLPFYGIMCLVYVLYGIIWLIVSFLQWRDLLRIQFWIGGVILLGMLEKAFFYAYYHSLNSTGVVVPSAEMAAEFVSCAKRTLARMLVIIMSLGFGIVKPRLGPMLHRVVGVGTLYFILACVESYLRVMHAKTKRSELLVANIPLAFVDSGICYWIFTSLVQTTRTLRLRRNMVKLSLYRHFTNTLIFSVIASTAFMFYSMRYNKKEYCTPGWRLIWFETAFWHILFSVLLLVIMILWRPTNNNQRYAFTPLLDNPEDEDDEEDQFVADTYGVKMRSNHTNVNGAKTPPNAPKNTTNEEDDLRWVEENIPSAMSDPALPVLDSDEEVMNTKFEVSKMQ
uniref:GOST seven transmembrane domain-containing protein n=1 Tax=Glossina brevipalpis TaxID=37001 RepID=A0A1A9W1R5_9MUSC